ncbi:acetyltransferase, GNAT family [Leptotrichia trevisanii]|uniref:Acetyltransferase, GNAT family n=1 Tax=Leptotrichia trevisanii TaxID=109328 RepID=A0A510L435_9FUSO|nr:GNAT family N-acetyltransferase [Leptotrichia trevisanii]BBM46273.1 acetyltransferase, GNAT family [Leptotrichia trevisanii]BBM58229.1 acetyltransferase, GNAT family [Leptotrichia trevisanii]
MIREINVLDAKDIQEICKDELGYDVDINTVKTQIEKLSIDYKHHIIAVYEDKKTSKVVGFVHAEMYESLYSDIGLNILGLAVNSNFQGKGIGKKLMVFVEEYALNNNVNFIRLNSGSHRLKAHKFYENIGYTCNKTQKRFIKIFQ